jgi:hypothetical protein
LSGCRTINKHLLVKAVHVVRRHLLLRVSLCSRLSSIASTEPRVAVVRMILASVGCSARLYRPCVRIQDVDSGLAVIISKRAVSEGRHPNRGNPGSHVIG